MGSRPATRGAARELSVRERCAWADVQPAPRVGARYEVVRFGGGGNAEPLLVVLPPALITPHGPSALLASVSCWLSPTSPSHVTGRSSYSTHRAGSSLDLGTRAVGDTAAPSALPCLI